MGTKSRQSYSYLYNNKSFKNVYEYENGVMKLLLLACYCACTVYM